MSSLRNEAAAARQLLQELAAAQAEPLDDETVDIVVDSETGLKEAISRAVAQIRDVEGHASACDDTAARIKERAARLRHKADRIRDAIASSMAFAGVKKLPLPEATISLIDRERKVVVTHPGMIPDKYRKIKTTSVVDTEKIAKHLLSGGELLGAMLDNGGQSIRIGTK